jgi:hypothetical protein
LSDILRYGAYLCLHVPDDQRQTVAVAPVPTLAGRLGLANEFEARDGHPSDAIAFLQCVRTESADIPDDGLLYANVVVHVASSKVAIVEEFCAEVSRLLGSAIRPYLLRGVVRPTVYTGNAMQEFAYANQLLQQPGMVAPNAFLIPTNKTPEWWAKDWMERHTYFLPRYDDTGAMISEGHALAAAAGITSLYRRTYKSETQPAPEGTYDFVNYFECADADLETFDNVCSALRDIRRNPEWKFVREGPMWRGRRVASWADLFA